MRGPGQLGLLDTQKGRTDVACIEPKYLLLSSSPLPSPAPVLRPKAYLPSMNLTWPSHQLPYCLLHPTSHTRLAGSASRGSILLLLLGIRSGSSICPGCQAQLLTGSSPFSRRLPCFIICAASSRLDFPFSCFTAYSTFFFFLIVFQAAYPGT